MRHFVWLASSIAARVALVGAVSACIAGAMGDDRVDGTTGRVVLYQLPWFNI